MGGAVIRNRHNYYGNRSHVYNRESDGYAFEVETVLKIAAAVIERYGWVSKSEVKESQESLLVSTASRVLQELRIDGAANVIITPENIELAQNALAWIQSIPDQELYKSNSDYLWKIKKMCVDPDDVMTPTVQSHQIGLLCSLVPAYTRDQIKLRELKKSIEGGDFVGPVGTRLEMLVIVLDVSSFNGDYGTGVRVRAAECLDPDAKDQSQNQNRKEPRQVIWFTNMGDSNRLDPMANTTYEVGSAYKIRGTVKEHRMRGNLPSTQLTRVKLMTAMHFRS